MKLAIITLIVLVVWVPGIFPIWAQDDGERPPITPENAGQVVELARLGRGTIRGLAWSPDGKTLAVAGSLGIWLYDAGDLDAEPRLLEGHTGSVQSVAFSPDGTLVASGSWDGTVRLWGVPQ